MSIQRFLKDWTLPIAITAGVAIYLLFHFLPILREVGLWYLPYNNIVLPLCSFAVLYVTFCKINYAKLRPVGWHLWLGALQVVIIACVMALILGLDLRGNTLILFEATLVCVISPCATAAAVVTAKLGGDLEEMTSYTLSSNFISALLIPLCFLLLPSENVKPAGAEVSFVHLFAAILLKVSSILLLPMVVAVATKLLLPKVHHYIIGVRDLSYNLWAFALVVVTATTMMNIFEAWHSISLAFLLSIALLAMVVCVVQFAVGRYFGRYSGKTVEAGQGLGQKNTTFAIWTATAFLNPLSSVGPGCYILWQNIINSIEIWMHDKEKTS